MPHPSKIALIAGTYQPDRCGVAHYTACLRSHLQPDIESIVLTTHAASADPTVQGVVTDWGLGQMPALVRAVLRSGADLLHIQHAAGTYGFDRAIFLLPLLLRLRGWQQPIVTTVHEYGWWEWQPPLIPPPLLEGLKQFGQRRGWWDREDGFLLTQSSAIITTNAAAADTICARLPQLRDRVVRIPIAANVEAAPIARSAARQWMCQQTGWAEDVMAIAFFGFLHPVKGLEPLLTAFQQVQAQHPLARLLLIGGVESLALRGEEAKGYWDRLHARVDCLGLAPFVHFTGYLPSTAASHFLSSADIGILPFNHGVTLKSGSLLTLLAHRLPTVATHADPPDPDLHPSGLKQIPPRDPAAIAAALLALIADADLRSRLAQRGCAFVEQFSWQAIAAQHRRVYAQRGQGSERAIVAS